MNLVDTKEKITELLESGADPEMPCFLLMGRDPSAPSVVRIWVTLTGATYRTSPTLSGMYSKCYQAYAISCEMETWQIEHGIKIPD